VLGETRLDARVGVRFEREFEALAVADSGVYALADKAAFALDAEDFALFPDGDFVAREVDEDADGEGEFGGCGGDGGRVVGYYGDEFGVVGFGVGGEGEGGGVAVGSRCC
jgi:hypothetical protein